MSAWSAELRLDEDRLAPDLARAVRGQPALSAFVNDHPRVRQSIDAQQIGTWLLAEVLWSFGRAGGRFHRVSAASLRRCEERLRPLVADLDRAPDLASFRDAARRAPRVQPHLLDEVFDPVFSGDAPLSAAARRGVYVAVWAASEALDAAWSPVRLRPPAPGSAARLLPQE